MSSTAGRRCRDSPVAELDDGSMDATQGIPPDFLEPLRRARDALTLGDAVGLALRAHRRELRLSQRAYAARRGLGRTMLARLEAGAGRMSLDTVVEALDGTGFALAVTRCGPDEPPGGDDVGARAVEPAQLAMVGAVVRRPIRPREWEATDLVARVRGGTRRFPAHRHVRAVDNPPLWWWMHEFFEGPSEEPRWYSPVPVSPLFQAALDVQHDAPAAQVQSQIDSPGAGESGAA